MNGGFADGVRMHLSAWPLLALTCKWARNRADVSTVRGTFSLPSYKKQTALLCFSSLFSCPGSRGFPSALLENTTWPRMHCGGAASADCGDRLLFSLCFHVEVRVFRACMCVCVCVGIYGSNLTTTSVELTTVLSFSFALNVRSLFYSHLKSSPSFFPAAHSAVVSFLNSSSLVIDVLKL